MNVAPTQGDALGAALDDPARFTIERIAELKASLDACWMIANAMWIGERRDTAAERALAVIVDELEHLQRDLPGRIAFVRDALSSIRASS